MKISRDIAEKTRVERSRQECKCPGLQENREIPRIRLTKAKLGQIIAILGAVVGAGFNTYFIGKVADASYYLYRERLLAARCGEGVIEVTVEPADEIGVDDSEFETDI